MGKSRLKNTRTGQYLWGTSPRQGFDGYATFPVVPSSPGRKFLPRLAMAVTPKLDYDVKEICRSVADVPNDVLFFCDTSLFDDSTDAKLWEALLDQEGKMVIIPQVLGELESWLTSRSTHPAARAILDEAPSVRFLGLNPSDLREHTAAEYYINLLGVRKRLLTLKLTRFEEEHGRPPNNGETQLLMRELHAEIGPRGYLLAKKGHEAKGSPNFFTDEVLVYLAMKTGIETGQDIVIISKDEDILEQFYKLQWLLDTHYRGMLFADAYASDSSHFITHSMPTNDSSQLRETFVGNDNLLVKRPLHFIVGDAAPILPPYCHPVIVHCWIIGDRLTQMAFCAEKEMQRLLYTKGVTSGLNTYKFGEKNCHLWLAPLNIPRSLRDCSAIASDNREEFGLVQFPLLDVNQAVFTGERFMRSIET